VATELNDRPRKTLGGITPTQAMQRLLWTPNHPSLRRPPEFAIVQRDTFRVVQFLVFWLVAESRKGRPLLIPMTARYAGLISAEGFSISPGAVRGSIGTLIAGWVGCSDK